MQPYQERVIEEKAQLDERLAKLAAFFATPVYAGLPPQERLRLCRQLKVMEQYSTVLAERIQAFDS